MTDRYFALLQQARQVLDRYKFDETGESRDDVIDICMKIDDEEGPATQIAAVTRKSHNSAAA